MSSPNRKLAEILAAKAGILESEDSVQTAGDIMRSRGAETLPVVENRRLVGMMDDPDPDLHAARYGHDPTRIRVGDAMNRDAVFCFDDQGCDEARELMLKNNLVLLPVVDREMRIVGILESRDLEQGR